VVGVSGAGLLRAELDVILGAKTVTGQREPA